MITIDETKQSFFDKVVEHLAQQKERAYEGGTCKYRTSKGLKCAFGVFIPDEEYATVAPFEGRSIRLLEALGVVKFTGEVSRLFAVVLQNIHDNSRDLSDLLNRLYCFASNENLDSSKIEKIKVWKVY